MFALVSKWQVFGTTTHCLDFAQLGVVSTCCDILTGIFYLPTGAKPHVLIARQLQGSWYEGYLVVGYLVTGCRQRVCHNQCSYLQDVPGPAN